MIIDSHAHIFPYFGSPTEYGSMERRMLYLQRAMGAGGPSKARDMSDHRPAALPRDVLWDQDQLGPEGRREAGLRVGAHGRVEFTYEGRDYYSQTFPPLMESMTSTPESLIALMDWAGVDVAVLQNDHIYGALNDYFSVAVGRYPNRFIGLAQVNEANLDSPDQIRQVDLASQLGLMGIYYKSLGLFLNGERFGLDDRRFDPFWSSVEDAGMPVYWDISPAAGTREAVLDHLARLDRLLSRWPNIPGVLHGGVLKLFKPLSDASSSIPAELAAVVQDHDVRLELMYPIFCGGEFDYPYPEVEDAVMNLYSTFGAEKLVWGSDAPNVERHCTYRQSLTYFSEYYTSIPKEDMRMILGGNLKALFDLAA